MGPKTVKLPYLTKMGRTAVSWFFKDPINQMWLPVTMIKRSRENIAANAVFDRRTAMEYMDRTQTKYRLSFPEEEKTVDMLINLASIKPDQQTIRDVCKEIVEQWDPGVVAHQTMSVVSVDTLKSLEPFSLEQVHIMASTPKLPLRKRPRLHPSGLAASTTAIEQGVCQPCTF